VNLQLRRALQEIGMWPTFRFLKGGIPRAYPRFGSMDSAVLASSCASVGTGEDEREARRCMSPRLPHFCKKQGAKVAHRPCFDRTSTKIVGYGEVKQP
jgi:hypothetical protein